MEELELIELSNCEKMILGCIYEYKQKYEGMPDLKYVMEAVKRKYEKEWKAQTVCTFLSRMQKKGILNISKKGRYSYYDPVLTHEEYLKKELKTISLLYFSGNVRQLKTFVRNNL